MHTWSFQNAKERKIALKISEGIRKFKFDEGQKSTFKGSQELQVG